METASSHSAPLMEQRGQIGRDGRKPSFSRRDRLGCGTLSKLKEGWSSKSGALSTCPLKEGSMPNVRSHSGFLPVHS